MKLNKKISLLASILFSIGALAGCDASNLDYEAAVEKVASVGAICRTSKNVSLYSTEVQENNTLASGSNVVVATSWTVGEVEVGLTWKIATGTGWTKKTKTPDDKHTTFIPTTPNYGEADLKQTFTCTISAGEVSKVLTYKVTVPASKERPIDYKESGLAGLYQDAIVDKTVLKKAVTIYGYCFGSISSGSNMFIGSGEYGCQIYKGNSYISTFEYGKCYKVTGTITNYYGMEIDPVTALEEYTGTDIPALSYVEATAAVVKSVTANGTRYDSAPVKATEATLVSWDSNNTAILKPNDATDDSSNIYCYLKSGIESTALADMKALFAGASAGDKFTIKGYQSYYSSKSAFEIIPMNAGDVVKIA